MTTALNLKSELSSIVEISSLWEALLSVPGVGVALIDREGMYRYLNSSYGDMFGYQTEELIGRSFTLLLPKNRRVSFLKEFRDSFVEGKVLPDHWESLTKKGEMVPHLTKAVFVEGKDGESYCLFLSWEDSHIRMEEALKATKLESMGMLAGGIAHDFNNILAGIRMNLALAKMDLEEEEEIMPLLDDIDKSCSHATELTQRFLTFSRGGKPIRSVKPLAPLVEDVVRLSLSGTNEVPQFEVASDLKEAEVDSEQIRQVVSALVINANQAMSSGGEIKITLENKKVDRESGLSLDKGDYLCLSIQDYGEGIEEAHLPKIFDPYFTTKEHASGLGLSAAYSIVQNHGGTIRVMSRVGKGSTFEIYLPAATKKKAEKKESRKKLHSGEGTILVMDDNEMLHKTLKLALKRMGYDIISTRNGEECLDVFHQKISNKEKIKLAILDLTVPGGMGGLETLRELKRLDSNILAVASSGYVANDTMADYKGHGFEAVLPKPFQVQELSKLLDNVLGA